MARWGRAILATALVAGGAARAQTTPPAPTPPSAPASAMPATVRVVGPGCAPGPFDADVWLALLRVELTADGVERVATGPEAPGDPPPIAALTLEVEACREDAGSVTVVIDDALTRKSVRRVIELGDVPRAARPRALALAVAELLRASWAELALPEAPPPAEPVPPSLRRAITLRLASVLAARADTPPAPVTRADTPPAPAPAPTPRRLLVSLGGGVRAFPGYNAALAGGRLAGSLAVRRGWPLRVRLDAGVQLGTGYDRLGEIDLGLASAALGVSLAGGGEGVVVELGLRGEVGWAWGAGRPYDPATPAGAGGGVVAYGYLTGALRARLAGRLWSLVELDGGVSLRGADINVPGGRAGGLNGPVVGLTLGLGYEL